jgi:hypothetical protein
MIIAAQDYDQPEVIIMKYLGWFFDVVAGPILLIFTSIYRDIVINILGNMDDLILRIFGLLGVGLGIFFIYLGLVVLSNGALLLFALR